MNGGQIPADAARVLGQWITYLEKSKSVAERVIWTEGQQNGQKCETWRKRDAHWGNPLPAEEPTSMKRAVLLNCLLDKAGLRFGKPLRGTARGVRQQNQGGLHWYSAALSDCFLPPAWDSSLQHKEMSRNNVCMYAACSEGEPSVKFTYCCFYSGIVLQMTIVKTQCANSKTARMWQHSLC